MTSLLSKNSMRSLISFNQVAEILKKEVSYESGYKPSSGSAGTRSGGPLLQQAGGGTRGEDPLL
jgi:hypothetical protein